MGTCRYCGESAGFWRKQHEECSERWVQAEESIEQICIDAGLYGEGIDDLPYEIRETSKSAGVDVTDDDLQKILLEGWSHALMAAADDHKLSSDEMRALNRYRRHFRLSPEQLDQEGSFTLFRMMAVLESINEDGVIPRRDRRSTRREFGRLPFNLMKSEALVWVFPDVGYAEQVTRREFRGNSLGASFRVANGIYVRPGTFRGRSVETKSMEQTDSGMLGITTKHIYFSGSEKSFRIRMERIVSFDPYQDGLGIMRDTARAKPEIFMMDAIYSWFVVNLIDSMLDMEDIALPDDNTPTLDDIIDDGDDDEGFASFTSGASIPL